MRLEQIILQAADEVRREIAEEEATSAKRERGEQAEQAEDSTTPEAAKRENGTVLEPSAQVDDAVPESSAQVDGTPPETPAQVDDAVSKTSAQADDAVSETPAHADDAASEMPAQVDGTKPKAAGHAGGASPTCARHAGGTVPDDARQTGGQLPGGAHPMGGAATDSASSHHVGGKRLAALIRAANRGVSDNADHIAKKHLMPFFLQVREKDPDRWERWGIEPATEERLLRLFQVKPRRTASGVATISVITKPWPCASDCLYCPNDLRMPKSYVADEPACQRAERNWFDPYLQVTARLRALREMGHVTDKVELIILGGTWNDYPAAYRRWFVAELFRALNEAGDPVRAEASANARRTRYEQAGIPRDEESCARRVARAQKRVNEEGATYTQMFGELYGAGTAWEHIASWQTANWDEVAYQHAENEDAAHRVVGLVMETRPDAVDARRLADMRRLGCTKVQMGIQSLDASILAANRRAIDPDVIRRAFELARLLGFKTHAHFMVNLLGATPEGDARDYRRLMEDAAIAPDEVKFYPCALVAGTDLVEHYRDGSWRPYTVRELTDVLARDLLETPPQVRVSRMIRDIPATDILTGNKKINLRQEVEAEADRLAMREGTAVREIRHREIGVEGAQGAKLRLDEVRYPTTVSHEIFLQWVTPEMRIAGFLRLSLPHADAIEQAAAKANAKRAETAQQASTSQPALRQMAETQAAGARTQAAEIAPSASPSLDRLFPIQPGEAMIREVHVYGRVAGLHRTSGGAQHRGLGRALVERACDIAREQGYTAINVISAVGTRGYYRRLGFSDNGLYQQRKL